MRGIESVRELKKLRNRFRAETRQRWGGGDFDIKKVRAHVLVYTGAASAASSEYGVSAALREEITKRGLDNEVQVVDTGCFGPCASWPAAVIYPDGIFYQDLKVTDAAEIVEDHILKGRVVEHLAYKAPDTGEIVPALEEIEYFKRQQKIALRNCGLIDPLDIDEYIARDGYQSLAKVLFEMTPEEVIETVKRSGLRGRGGAGFPTGLKWQFCRRATGKEKYVLCNADEGNPGAFMDRSILEGDPQSIIEAMIIAAYAIGSSQGYVYVRVEYARSIDLVNKAIEQAREYGLLGKDILGSGFDFDLEVRIGGGVFVCGEETALMASIEGKRGEPRPRPPFPANQGVWDMPSLLNNVETYANIALIILNGAEWYASFGTEKSKGTKVLSLSGAVKNTGVVEVPMGTPLKEIIYDIGGGIRRGKSFKAALFGGPSGGFVPKEYLHLPVDYESLDEIGSMMGAGGVIIMDEDVCMVDMARFFLEFVQDESCGKCPPCRIGTRRMLEIVTRITEGEGEEGDLEKLVELGGKIADASLCGLGQAAPNPVLSAIKFFGHEFDAHIHDKHCPTGVCRKLTSA